jgi:hypothetical protein
VPTTPPQRRAGQVCRHRRGSGIFFASGDVDSAAELLADGQPVTLRFSGGHLGQVAGEPADPILTVHTTSVFMDRWAAGTASWDDGRTTGEVTLVGPSRNWDLWLAGTGYLLSYDPEPDHA